MLNSHQNGKCSFIFKTLLVHTTTSTISIKNPFLRFRQFSPPILLLLVHKIIPTIPNNSPFLYTSAIFYLLIFAYNQPSQQSIAKISSLPQPLSQFSLHQGTRELGCLFGTDIILTSHFFLKVWTVTTGLTITGSLSLRIRILVYCR